MLTRLIAGACATVLALLAPALAGEEVSCAKQYSLEEHLILEWAALGGDPHAQFALAQCAFPDGAKNLSPAEKAYAVQWTTLARCELSESDDARKHHQRTQNLKAQGDLSFRRFDVGAIDFDDFSTREKMFLQYRFRKNEELINRHERVLEIADENDKAAARSSLVERFSGMGEIGLVRLAQLASCPHFEASVEFEAASWSAASEAWKTSPLSEIVGKSDRRGWDPAREARMAMKMLDPISRQRAGYETGRLLKKQPQTIAALEDRAAVADLEKLSSAAVHAYAGAAPSNTVTLAVQFALEALGLIEFVNGPDNDYGPATTSAINKLQASWGAEETRWLSPTQIRDTICKAAVETGDPISLYHVALMHANGWGFPRNPDRARDAIVRAENAIKVRLDAIEELPAWKQARYPRYVSEIEAEKLLIEAALNARPDDARAAPASSAEGLCPSIAESASTATR